MLIDLKDRVAIVTGAGRGIGREIAETLAAEGVRVVIADIRQDLLDEAGAHWESKGWAGLMVACDVRDPSSCDAAVAAAEAKFGRVDILVNNAGIARPQPIAEIREQDWDEVITVNLKSCFLATQAVLPGMRIRQWGRIVNLSSVAAQVGGVVGPHYAASKAGMLGLTRYYASHLASEGITVNAIAPALIDTDMVSANPNATAARIPVGRLGHVDEVAQVAVMLAGNGYITGQTVNVNGGWFLS